MKYAFYPLILSARKLGPLSQEALFANTCFYAGRQIRHKTNFTAFLTFNNMALVGVLQHGPCWLTPKYRALWLRTTLPLVYPKIKIETCVKFWVTVWRQWQARRLLHSEECPLNFCVCVAVPTRGVSIGGGTQGPLCHSGHYAPQTRFFLIVLGANCSLGCDLMTVLQGFDLKSQGFILMLCKVLYA